MAHTQPSEGRRRRGASLLASRAARLTALLVGATVLLPTVAAQATTGADALNRPPIYKVSAAQAKPFIGGYKLSSHGSGIIASTFRTGYNTEGYLMGTISVTRYTDNQPSSFVASLYEYRRQGNNMLVDLWTPDLGSDRLGLLTLHSTGASLTGTLNIGSTKAADAVPVSFKPISDSAAQSAVSQSAVDSTTTQALTTNAGIFSTAVVLAESIRG